MPAMVIGAANELAQRNKKSWKMKIILVRCDSIVQFQFLHLHQRSHHGREEIYSMRRKPVWMSFFFPRRVRCATVEDGEMHVSGTRRASFVGTTLFYCFTFLCSLLNSNWRCIPLILWENNFQRPEWTYSRLEVADFYVCSDCLFSLAQAHDFFFFFVSIVFFQSFFLCM